MCVCTSCCDQSSGPLSHLDHGNSAITQATAECACVWAKLLSDLGPACHM
jgi:hypothetical protein